MSLINSKLIRQRIYKIMLPVICIAGIITGSLQIKRTPIASETKAVYAKAVVQEVLKDMSGGEPFGGSQEVRALVTGGKYKGEECILVNSNSYQRGAFCTKGTKIIALLAMAEDGKLSGSVYNYDRTGMIYLLIGLFVSVLLVVGRGKGAASVYALIFILISIVFMYIPLLYIGVNGVAAAVFTSVIILIISIYILNGWSEKTLCAIIGTTIGVAVSGILAMVFGQAANINGFHMSDVESMVYIANNTKLRTADILYAGVLISSLGAVMDVSVSMAAALYEIKEKVPNIGRRELFVSGMRVGHDMMGTMSNTLILAYAGSATSVLLTVYSYEMSYLQIMGNNSIIIEIVNGLCGTIGVVLTVPVQAAVTTFIMTWRKK